MKIVDLRTTTVSVPLEAPLRHANGTHWGSFIRTIVEVVCDTGVVGLGEKGGGGASADGAFPVYREIEVYRALSARPSEDRPQLSLVGGAGHSRRPRDHRPEQRLFRRPVLESGRDAPLATVYAYRHCHQCGCREF